MSLKQICFYAIFTFGIISICFGQPIEPETGHINGDSTVEESVNEDLLSSNNT